MIANLLRSVDPAQTYSHSGIMVEDRHKIRHSTASVDWLLTQKAGDPPGSEGLLEKALKRAWPGTITQWADEALEGAFLKDPSNVYFELKPFNSEPVQCGADGPLIPDTILKPPPLVDADPISGARARLHAAADAAVAIDGHYRFFGYSQPADVLYSAAVVPNDWADGTVGSVCSAFVWRSMQDAGITLEGNTVETQDVEERGAMVDAQTPDGLYVYTVAERAAAAAFIYKRSGRWSPRRSTGSRTSSRMSPTISATRWSTASASTGAARRSRRSPSAAGCDPNDERAQDSPCWLNEGPGIGRAVSPDNMLNWDIAPNGPYGYREDLAFAIGGYHRIFRWRAAEGTGTLQGVDHRRRRFRRRYAPVILDGFNIADFADAAGFYKMEGVPAGAATVRTCTGDRGRSAIVSITRGPYHDQQPGAAAGCNQAPDPGKWRRKIRVLWHGQDHRHRGFRQRRSERVEPRRNGDDRTEHHDDSEPRRADLRVDQMHRRRSAGEDQSHRPAQRARPISRSDARQPDVRRDLVQRQRSRQHDDQAAGGAGGWLEEPELPDGERGVRRRGHDSDHPDDYQHHRAAVVASAALAERHRPASVTIRTVARRNGDAVRRARGAVGSLLCCCAIACALLRAPLIAQPPVPVPNVVVLVIDDTRWDSIGGAGNRIVRTPRLDRLAADGIRFSQARVTTSICMVSRATLLTGQYMSRHGIDQFGKPLTPQAFASTYPGLLRSAGYWTGYVGKYDVGAARPADFDFVRTYQGRHWLESAGGERVHVTEQNARDSIDFLRARPRDKPFLLSVGFFAAHAEDSAKEQYLPQDWSAAAYRGVKVPPSPLGGAKFLQALPPFLSADANEGRVRFKWRFDTPERYQDT